MKHLLTIGLRRNSFKHAEPILNMTQPLEFAANHLILAGAFFFILALLIVNVLQDSASKGLIPIQAVQLLNRENALPLDVRGAADFAAGHIINARNIPADEIKSRIDELKKFSGRPILVYCASGQRSAGVVKELASAGLDKVYTLKGGIAAWRSDNLPLA
jgi:rhodanese-related sulfurtransferase